MSQQRLRLKGKVVRGRGQATAALVPFHQDIAGFLGKPVVPGSLNVVAARPILFSLDHAVLKYRNGAGGERWFWPVTVSGIPCLATRWKWCPLHILEIVSPVYLRAAKGVIREGQIDIEISHESVRLLPWEKRVGWWLVWKGREALWYESNGYAKLTRRLRLGYVDAQGVGRQ